MRLAMRAADRGRTRRSGSRSRRLGLRAGISVGPRHGRPQGSSRERLVQYRQARRARRRQVAPSWASARSGRGAGGRSTSRGPMPISTPGRASPCGPVTGALRWAGCRGAEFEPSLSEGQIDLPLGAQCSARRQDDATDRPLAPGRRHPRSRRRVHDPLRPARRGRPGRVASRRTVCARPSRRLSTVASAGSRPAFNAALTKAGANIAPGQRSPTSFSASRPRRQ